MINIADRLFEILFLNTQNDIQLTGSLIDHTDIDVRVGCRFEDLGSRSLGTAHTAANSANPRSIQI